MNISRSPVTDCGLMRCFKKTGSGNCERPDPKGLVLLHFVGLPGKFKARLAGPGREGEAYCFVDTGSDGFSHLNVYELETEQRTA